MYSLLRRRSFTSNPRRQSHSTCRLSVEALEDRNLLSTVVSVDVTNPWQDTGIAVVAGQRLVMTTPPDQLVDFGEGNLVNADGLGFFSNQWPVLPNAIFMSLIGKIGGTTNATRGVPTDGNPVPEGRPGAGAGFVGTSYSEVIPWSGELLLGFNDNIGAFYDNSGHFTVTVDVVRKPDLAVTRPTWSAGQGVNFSYTISGADLTAPTTVGLYWSPDSHFDKGQDMVAYGTMTQTAQSPTPYAVSVTHDQLAPPPPGTKYLLAVIDPNNTIQEADAPLQLQDTITISSPTADSMIYMTGSDGRIATVPLQVDVGGFVTGNINWKFDLQYVSPVTHKVFDYSPPIGLSVSDCIGQPYDFPVTGKGGNLTLQASAVVDGTQITSDAVAAEIQGYQQVPTDAIINTLSGLYGSLFVGVADVESKFYTEGKGQFNLDGTPYITNNVGVGLMQIAVKYWNDPSHGYDDFATFWDWQVNAARATVIFNSYLSTVDTLVVQIRSKPGNENLPALSEDERENWALGLYSGEAKGKHLYKPNADGTSWIVNPRLPSGAKAYVNAVRNRAFQITGDDTVLDGLIP